MVPNMNSMKVLFWRGCTLRNILSETIAKIEYIFKKANIDVITLDIEGCCGYPLILAGYEKQFETCALNLLEKIKELQPDVIVTHCPGCLRTFIELYPRNGFEPLYAVHTTQLLLKLINLGNIGLKNSINLKVTYHDPCDLGRHLGIYNEPREIIKSIPGITFIELPEISMGKYSRCCGGGGLIRLAIPPLASQIAIDRIIEDIVGLDVQAIITSCPTCVKTLFDASSIAENIYGVSLKVLDIIDLVYEAMG